MGGASEAGMPQGAAPVDDAHEDITVDRYTVEGMLPWTDDDTLAIIRAHAVRRLARVAHLQRLVRAAGCALAAEFQRVHRDQLRLALGQGAGLVDDQSVHAGEALDLAHERDHQANGLGCSLHVPGA